MVKKNERSLVSSLKRFHLLPLPFEQVFCNVFSPFSLFVLPFKEKKKITKKKEGMRPMSLSEIEWMPFDQLHPMALRRTTHLPPVALLSHRTTHFPEDVAALRGVSSFFVPQQLFRHRNTPPQRSSTDNYEALLSLDEGNTAKKGINVATQRRVLKHVRHLKKKEFCTVCQEDIDSVVGERWVVQMPKCVHVFHFDCVSPWLLKDRTCPTCRVEVHPCAVP